MGRKKSKFQTIEWTEFKESQSKLSISTLLQVEHKISWEYMKMCNNDEREELDLEIKKERRCFESGENFVDAFVEYEKLGDAEGFKRFGNRGWALLNKNQKNIDLRKAVDVCVEYRENVDRIHKRLSLV